MQGRVHYKIETSLIEKFFYYFLLFKYEFSKYKNNLTLKGLVVIHNMYFIPAYY